MCARSGYIILHYHTEFILGGKISNYYKGTIVNSFKILNQRYKKGFLKQQHHWDLAEVWRTKIQQATKNINWPNQTINDVDEVYSR